MAFWTISLIRVIIAASMVKIVIPQNHTFDDFRDEFKEPEEICSYRHLSCNKTWNIECQCDDLCDYYGDCCWNAFNMSRVYPQWYLAKELFQCRSFPGLENGEYGINFEPTGYLMVSRCPENTSVEMKARCEQEPEATLYVHAKLFLPVKDGNDFIYKNVYCARCNGIDDSSISTWEVSHYCKNCPASLDLLPEHVIKLSDKNCQLSANFQWKAARRCFTGLVDSCPRDFRDNDVVAKCHRYLSIGTWNYFTWYKNPHCAICNGSNPFKDYICSETYLADLNLQLDDLFSLPSSRYPQFPSIRETAPIFAEQVEEVSKLSECTHMYPQNLYLTVSVLYDGQQSSFSCPYFGKRLEICLLNELQRLPRNDIALPWRQVVKFPDEDPFAKESPLLFYITPAFSLKRKWEPLLAEIFKTLEERSKETCHFQDIHILRVCGNMTNPEDIIKFNTPYILTRAVDNSFTDIINPDTLDTVKDVSWFAFEGNIRGRRIQAYKSQICQKNQTRNTVIVKTKNYLNIDNLSPTSEPSSSKKRPFMDKIFSDICIVFSVICLLITFITYCVFPLLRNTFGITLMNFVAALATGQFFIHFVTDYVTQWRVVCKAVAIATHFVWLATFAWMNLLAWDLKFRFDSKNLQAAPSSSRKTLIGYFCYGWIVPFCVVSLCCATFVFFSDTIPITYGLIGANRPTCWIGNGWVTLTVVVGPLTATIILNGVLFSLIVIGIRQSLFRPDDREGRWQKGRSKFAELSIYIKISLLMGFVWLLGFAISFDNSRVLWYTFYVLQALQGILVMLVFALSGRVRSMWKSKFQIIIKNSKTGSSLDS